MTVGVQRSLTAERDAQPAAQGATAWRWYGVAVGACALLFHFVQAQPVPTNVYVAGITVAAICLFPIARWYAVGARRTPMFELICLAYLVQFDLPVFLNVNGVFIQTQVDYVPWNDTFQTLILVGLGVGTMIAIFYMTINSRLTRKLGHVDLPLDPDARRRYITVGIALGLIATLVPIPFSSIESIARVIANQLNVAIILLAYEVYRGRADRRWTFLLYAAVAGSALTGLSSGVLESAATPFVLLFVVYWHAKKRVPVRVLSVGLIIFVLLQSDKTDYRRTAWLGPQAATLSQTQRAELWLTLLTSKVQQLGSGDVAANLETTVQASVGRLDFVHIFARVHSLTPSLLPYYQGISYQYFISGWVPRVVWPDKPEAIAAQRRLTVDYGFQLPTNVTSYSFGLGQITEAYANFGPLGVIIFMLLQGLFLALVTAVLDGPKSDGGRAVYLSVMVILLNGIGASTAVIFGAMIQNIFSNCLIVRLFARSWTGSENNRADAADRDDSGTTAAGQRPGSAAPRPRRPLPRTSA